MSKLVTYGRSAVGALLALALIGSAPSSAKAQDFFSALFGGGAGYSSSVSFSKRYKPRQIIVSFGDRKLYYIYKRGQAISYPIAVPRPKSIWAGTMRVTRKRKNPGWTPTPAMRRENPKLPVHVPGGHPMNPMGTRALYLGSSLYRIHGTDAPWTIGSAVSKGCIRMYNQDAEDLYARVPVGTKVTVTWKKFSTY
ncbi:MAG: L,D-transpeptidase [Pseudomonadota bacterium]